MDDLFTCGIWIVMPGSEEEFVAAWGELARWTDEQVPGAGWATLLQDAERSNRFISVGPWDSLEAISAWRASDGFRARVARIRDLLESFEPGVFHRRAGVGTG